MIFILDSVILPIVSTYLRNIFPVFFFLLNQPLKLLSSFQSKIINSIMRLVLHLGFLIFSFFFFYFFFFIIFLIFLIFFPFSVICLYGYKLMARYFNFFLFKFPRKKKILKMGLSFKIIVALFLSLHKN